MLYRNIINQDFTEQDVEVVLLKIKFNIIYAGDEKLVDFFGKLLLESTKIDDPEKYKEGNTRVSYQTYCDIM
jgi:hypothetical protein